ncbi:MAG: hypothetical protein SFV15_14660 [Polyangiaceae bacterium]|nr:hypothetical protein [Polyangiaceae bacterium]
MKPSIPPFRAILSPANLTRLTIATLAALNCAAMCADEPAVGAPQGSATTPYTPPTSTVPLPEFLRSPVPSANGCGDGVPEGEIFANTPGLLDGLVLSGDWLYTAKYEAGAGLNAQPVGRFDLKQARPSLEPLQVSPSPWPNVAITDFDGKLFILGGAVVSKLYSVTHGNTAPEVVGPVGASTLLAASPELLLISGSPGCEPNTIYGVSKGGMTLDVIEQRDGCLDGIAADSENIYWSEAVPLDTVFRGERTLYQRPLVGGAPKALLSGTYEMEDLFVKGQYVYLIANKGSSLVRVPKSGGAPERVLQVPDYNLRVGTPYFDGDNLYLFHECLTRWSPITGEITEIAASPTGYPRMFASSPNHGAFVVYLSRDTTAPKSWITRLPTP